MTVRWTVRAAERLCPQAKKSFCPCQIRNSRLIQSYRPTVFFLSLKVDRKSLIYKGFFLFRGAFRYVRCLYVVPRKPQNAEKHYSPSRCSAFLSLKDWYSLKSHNDIYSTIHSRVPLKLPVECADRIWYVIFIALSTGLISNP